MLYLSKAKCSFPWVITYPTFSNPLKSLVQGYSFQTLAVRKGTASDLAQTLRGQKLLDSCAVKAALPDLFQFATLLE